MITPGVGDVLTVRTGGWGSYLIRLGERLHGLPSLDNHVVVMHHTDSAGVPWGIEGRPGGVGWVDCRPYLASKYTLTNADQPKTFVQRVAVADTVQQMLGDKYDWVGIGADACKDLDLPLLFAKDWHGKGMPGHVVCSSLAAYAYYTVGLGVPLARDGERFCQPGDWTKFIKIKGWVT